MYRCLWWVLSHMGQNVCMYMYVCMYVTCMYVCMYVGLPWLLQLLNARGLDLNRSDGEGMYAYIPSYVQYTHASHSYIHTYIHTYFGRGDTAAHLRWEKSGPSGSHAGRLRCWRQCQARYLHTHTYIHFHTYIHPLIYIQILFFYYFFLLINLVCTHIHTYIHTYIHTFFFKYMHIT